MESLVESVIDEKFPSPYGEEVLKAYKREWAKANRLKKFPSPYGEEVLKVLSLWVVGEIVTN